MVPISGPDASLPGDTLCSVVYWRCTARCTGCNARRQSVRACLCAHVCARVRVCVCLCMQVRRCAVSALHPAPTVHCALDAPTPSTAYSADPHACIHTYRRL